METVHVGARASNRSGSGAAGAGAPEVGGGPLAEIGVGARDGGSSSVLAGIGNANRPSLEDGSSVGRTRPMIVGSQRTVAGVSARHDVSAGTPRGVGRQSAATSCCNFVSRILACAAAGDRKRGSSAQVRPHGGEHGDAWADADQTEVERRVLAANLDADTDVVPFVAPPGAFDALPHTATEPDGSEVAYFGMGCLWEAEAAFGGIDGVVRTRVGFAGGNTANPTLLRPGNHAQVVEIHFDPMVVTFQQLLHIFWGSHDGTETGLVSHWSLILVVHDGQRRRAASFLSLQQAKIRQRIATRILPMTEFHEAELKYQRYFLQQNRVLLRQFSAWPTQRFVNSWRTTKINSVLAGHGTAHDLSRHVGKMGLDKSGIAELTKAAAAAREHRQADERARA